MTHIQKTFLEEGKVELHIVIAEFLIATHWVICMYVTIFVLLQNKINSATVTTYHYGILILTQAIDKIETGVKYITEITRDYVSLIPNNHI